MKTLVNSKKHRTHEFYRQLDRYVVLLPTDPHTAYRKLVELKKTAEENDHRAGMLLCAARIGWCHLFMSQFNKAMETFLEALEEGWRCDCAEHESVVFSGLSATCGYLNMWSDALEYNIECVRIARTKRKDRSILASALNNQGLLYMNLGDYRLARERYEKAIEIMDQQERAENLIIACHNLAENEILDGSPGQAEQHLVRVESLRRRSDLAAVDIANTPRIRGMQAEYREQYAEAEELYRRSIILYEEQLITPDAVNVYHRLGRLLWKQNQNESAVNVFETAMRHFREQNPIPLYAEILGDAAEIFKSLGDYQKTVEYLERQRQVTRALQNRMVAFTSINTRIQEHWKEMKNNAVQYRRKNRELQKAIEVSEKLNKAKNTFIANISHEIRTPITGILGLTDISLKETDNPLLIENLELIQMSTRNLLEIINEILDFSRISSGGTVLKTENFNPGIFFLDLTRLFREDCRKKGLNITLAPLPELPEILIGDTVKLKRIMINLIGNSVKFTRRGGITLRIEEPEKRRKTDSIMLKIMVIDTGIGIAPENQHDIFNEFQQIDDSYSRTSPGTGLGLAICRKLTEVMGGSIALNSIPGEGSTFTVSLRFGIAAPSRQKTTPAPVEKTDSTPRTGFRILLAEDNLLNQRFLHHFLTKKGHIVTLVENGFGVLEQMASKPFDIILMDIHMPGMDGLEATRQLRDKAITVPIIAISAAANETEQKTFLEAGIDDLVTKPVDMERLHSIIDKLAVQ